MANQHRIILDGDELLDLIETINFTIEKSANEYTTERLQIIKNKLTQRGLHNVT